jgi:hypothetical protein
VKKGVIVLEKQRSNRLKKTMAILIAILFLVSLTTAMASACKQQKHNLTGTEPTCMQQKPYLICKGHQPVSKQTPSVPTDLERRQPSKTMPTLQITRTVENPGNENEPNSLQFAKS